MSDEGHPLTALNHYKQTHHKGIELQWDLKSDGPPHALAWHAKLTFGGILCAGSAGSKTGAKNLAAAEALRLIDLGHLV